MPEFPQGFENLGAIAFTIALGICGAVYYFTQRRASDEAPNREQLRMLGAALGDSQALDRLREELRELRASVEDAARNTIRSNDLMAAICEAIKGIEHAIRDQKIPVRRR